MLFRSKVAKLTPISAYAWYKNIQETPVVTPRATKYKKSFLFSNTSNLRLDNRNTHKRNILAISVLKNTIS